MSGAARTTCSMHLFRGRPFSPAALMTATRCGNTSMNEAHRPILSRTARTCRPSVDRYRNLVERFFNKIKHYRAVATRYDKTPKTSSPE